MDDKEEFDWNEEINEVDIIEYEPRKEKPFFLNVYYDMVLKACFYTSITTYSIFLFRYLFNYHNLKVFHININTILYTLSVFLFTGVLIQKILDSLVFFMFHFEFLSFIKKYS